MDGMRNQGPTLIIVSSVFLALTTLFFSTRLLWRLSHARQLGWDDAMASLAYATLVVQTSFGYAAAHDGFGRHRADLTELGFERAMRWFWGYQICYKLLGGFTKLNFCFLYLRIFDGSGLVRFQRLVWATAGIITAGTLAFTMGTLTQCRPIARNWNHGIHGSCIDYLAFWLAHAVFNTLMDLVVYILPIRPLLSLQIARRTKSGLLAIFALGAFTIAASIARMAMLPGSAKSATDPTWGSMSALVWTEVEANTSVICCCLPALRIVAVRIWERWKGREGDEEWTTTPTTPKGGHDDAAKVKSKDPAGTRLPQVSTGFGLVTQARYSPPSTRDGEREERRGWLRRQLRPLSPPGSSATAMVADRAPQLEWGGLEIYRTTQVQTDTNRDSGCDLPRANRDGRVWKMEARPEREAAGRDVTLQEMLAEGAVVMPSPSVARWR